MDIHKYRVNSETGSHRKQFQDVVKLKMYFHDYVKLIFIDHEHSRAFTPHIRTRAYMSVCAYVCQRPVCVG
jgi:hypothetical protein